MLQKKQNLKILLLCKLLHSLIFSDYIEIKLFCECNFVCQIVIIVINISKFNDFLTTMFRRKKHLFISMSNQKTLLCRFSQSIESLVRVEIIKDMVFVRDKVCIGSISFMFGIIKLINIKTTFMSDSPGIIII